MDPTLTMTRPLGEKRERKRGLLDLVAVAMAVYAMMITTPVGALVARAYHYVTGEERATRPLLSYFQMEGMEAGQGTQPLVAAISEPPKADAATSVVAKRVGLAPELARAVAVLAANGKEGADGHLEVVLSPAARASFAEVGAFVPPDNALAETRETALLEGLAKLRDRLGGDEAAVAAVAVDFRHVAFAVERATASRMDTPTAYESFRPFLPPEHRGEADALVDGTFALTIAFNMKWPVSPDAPVSSKFGYREHPVLGKKSFHTGTDIAVPTGTAIESVAEGRVVHATEDSVNGRFVKIDHGHGLTSAYCHASSLDVLRGDNVPKGRRVALSGATGRATGPHLHFQMELNGHPVNPELFRRPVRLATR